MNNSSSAKTRVGVIGVGHLGSHHARILNEAPQWNLVGVYDTNSDRNSEAASRHALNVYNDYHDLLGDVEAVTICTPTESHFRLAREAAERGIHVFVEKPICASDEEAAQLVDIVAKAGVCNAAGHIERFNPAINAIRDHIGVPRFVEAHRLNQFTPRGLSTDVILELMIHDIDLVRWLVGSEPIEIRAAGVPVLSQTDDIANCRLAFANGCVANLTASRISANPMRKIRVFSKDHYTSVDLSAKSVESYKLFGEDIEAVDPGYWVLAQSEGKKIARWNSPLESYDALEAELENFRQAVMGTEPARVDLAEAAKSLRVALAVAQACRDQVRATQDEPSQPQPVADR